MSQAMSNAVPADLGTKDFERISRLLRASDYYLMQYRMTHNHPSMQRTKALYWQGYQETLADLMEALNA